MHKSRKKCASKTHYHKYPMLRYLEKYELFLWLKYLWSYKQIFSLPSFLNTLYMPMVYNICSSSMTFHLSKCSNALDLKIPQMYMHLYLHLCFLLHIFIISIPFTITTMMTTYNYIVDISTMNEWFQSNLIKT